MTLFAQGFKVRGGQLVRTRTEHRPRADLVAFNQEQQRNPGDLHDLTFGRLMLNMDFADLVALRQKYPDLASPDAETRTQAWLRFMNSDEAEPYRLHHRRRPRSGPIVSPTPTTADRARRKGY